MTKYFFKDMPGLNADIERHTERLKRIDEKIASVTPPKNKFEEQYLAAFKGFRQHLMDSRDQLTSKIGKKNT